MKKSLSLIEAPISKGSPTRGSEHAFEALVSRGLAEVLDARTLPMSRQIQAEEIPESDKYRDAATVMPVCRALAESVKEELKSGSFPLIIGGDHSIAMGSISGDAAVVSAEELSVIYLDGHADINTEMSTISGYIHGMPLASAMGLCRRELTVGDRKSLYGKNTFIVGARSIDDGEWPIIKEEGVHLYPAEEVKQRGIGKVIEEVLSSIKTKAIHISFDVDAIDGDEFPATGYVMPGGLTREDITSALGRILSDERVISLDCVEYNPKLDPTGENGSWLIGLLYDLFV